MSVGLVALLSGSPGCGDECIDACEPEPGDYWVNSRVSGQITTGASGALLTWFAGDDDHLHTAPIANDGTLAGQQALGASTADLLVPLPTGYGLVKLGYYSSQAVSFLALDESGTPVGDWRLVASLAPIPTYEPQEIAAAEVDDQLWIAWTSYEGTRQTLRIVRLDREGFSVDGQPRTIAELFDRDSLGRVAITRLGDGVLVAWTRGYHDDAGDRRVDIDGRYLGLDGLPAGPPTTLLEHAAAPVLAARGRNGMLTAFRRPELVTLALDETGSAAGAPVIAPAPPGVPRQLLPSPADPSGYTLLVADNDPFDRFPCTDCSATVLPLAADGTAGPRLAMVVRAEASLAAHLDGYLLLTVDETASGDTGTASLDLRTLTGDGSPGPATTVATSEARLERFECD